MKERIKKDRTKRNMTQTQYATLLGVSEPSIRNYESGRRKPSQTFLIAMQLKTEVLQLAHKKSKRGEG